MKRMVQSFVVINEEINKQLNTMQNHYRQHILAIPFLRTTASFSKDNPVFLVE